MVACFLVRHRSAALAVHHSEFSFPVMLIPHCSGVRRVNSVRVLIPGDSVTDKLSHRQVTGTLFWLGILSHSGWDSSQSYWDRRVVVLILRKGNEHFGRYVEL